MKTAASWLYVLAGVLGVAGLVTGGLLLAHSVQDCSDLVCQSTHPFVAAGVAAMIGGVVQTVVIATVGYLCDVVADLRAAAGGDGDPTGSEALADGPMPTMYGTKD